MKILGLNASGPNTSACLVDDGEIVAFAEEERFSRIKLASGAIPTRASAFCLARGGMDLAEVDAITVGWAHSKYPGFMGEFYQERMSHPQKDVYSDIYEEINLRQRDPRFYGRVLEMAYRRAGYRGEFPRVEYFPHHLCHAYSVFYPSPFDEALILVIDGSGEEMATTVWIGRDKSIEFQYGFNLPDSIGYFYAAITEYLGFQAYRGEGKVMGLAPYGEPNAGLREKLERVIWVEGDGYRVDPTYIYFSERTHSFRHTDRLSELLGRPPRVPGSELDPWHEQLAWETQDRLERIVQHLVGRAVERTGIRDVAVAGGVAMNCKMNGFISELDVVDNCFVIPASNDAGVALGSALAKARAVPGVRERAQRFSVYAGPEFSDDFAARRLEEFKARYRRLEDDELFAYAAKRLAEGDIIGWFQGRMEMGPRALGNRSILANPAFPDMKARINAEVKHREGFRPFAPAVLGEEASSFFAIPPKQSYEPYHSWMLQAAQALPGVAERMPSAVHVDNSIRPQVVTSRANPRFHRLLSEFQRATGLGALLNTSFNVRGEPIVCTPDDALRCFYSTGLDVLVLGNIVIEK